MDIWRPAPERKMILNLPDTVEVATPNVYADQVEWMCRNIKDRDSLLISLHTHNDRCTGVAATELGLLAGADRVEGTLFGNGERTGNLNLVTVALNLYMQGIDPKLDFSDLNALREVYERCTGMTVPPRQPYAGELVFTAFSGSHQDAIKKGLGEWAKEGGRRPWDVPYLTIDPTDIGRQYREVIRVNSQSGKGGVAYLLETEFGIELPKEMQREFGPIANNEVDRLGREVSGAELKDMFWREYIERAAPWQLEGFETETKDGAVRCRARLLREGQPIRAQRPGQRPAGRPGPRLRLGGRAPLRDRPLQRACLERRRRGLRHRLHPDPPARRPHPLGRRGRYQHRTGLGPRRAQRPQPLQRPVPGWVNTLWQRPGPHSKLGSKTRSTYGGIILGILWASAPKDQTPAQRGIHETGAAG